MKNLTIEEIEIEDEAGIIKIKLLKEEIYVYYNCKTER